MALVLDKERIPRHIAIIMDGNGRWAKEKRLARTEGHREGMKRVEEIVDAADAFTEILIERALKIASQAAEISRHAGRKTVNEGDIKLAAKQQ